ncbi:hypothetical protein JKG47_20620 [Acidithiobacillus sp. MC6.1]|nr:hypothetical protein [Acidithiobacillus sp. MC6.1]
MALIHGQWILLIDTPKARVWIQAPMPPAPSGAPQARSVQRRWQTVRAIGYNRFLTAGNRVSTC